MKLLKIFGTALLIFAVIILISSALIIYFVKFDNDSLAAQEIRNHVVRSPLLVSLINLNEPGDARYVYLRSTKILDVNVYHTKNAAPNDNVGEWVRDMVHSTADKYPNVRLTEIDLPEKDKYGDEDLNGLRERFIRSTNYPSVNIFYLTTYEEAPSNIGITIHRDTMYIFKNAINGLSEDEFRRSRLERSTVMHEWGHLLDLQHVSKEDCIMSERVDVDDRNWMQGKEIPVEYCPETLYQHKNRL